MVFNSVQQCFRCLLKYCNYCAAFVVETVWIVVGLSGAAEIPEKPPLIGCCDYLTEGGFFRVFRKNS